MRAPAHSTTPFWPHSLLGGNEPVGGEVGEGASYAETVKPPIFVFEGDDVLAFRTVACAEAFIEETSEGDLVFDSEGRRLTFERASPVKRWPGYTLRLREQSQSSDEKALREALMRACVADVGVEHANGMTTAELVEHAAARFDIAKASSLRSAFRRYFVHRRRIRNAR